MGPILEDSIQVVTGIWAGQRLRSSHSVAVPRPLLSRSMQLLHQRGVSVLAVGQAQAVVTSQAEPVPSVDPEPAAAAGDDDQKQSPRRRSPRRKG